MKISPKERFLSVSLQWKDRLYDMDVSQSPHQAEQQFLKKKLRHEKEEMLLLREKN